MGGDVWRKRIRRGLNGVVGMDGGSGCRELRMRRGLVIRSRRGLGMRGRRWLEVRDMGSVGLGEGCI